MQFLLKYIIVGLMLLAVAFAGEKSKKGGLQSEGLLFNVQEFLEGDDSGNEVERKRAHKRKRKIRPRRNGF